MARHDGAPPRSHARLWVSTLLLVAYAGFVLLVTMWPNPSQLQFDGIAARVLQALHNLGVPEWFGYNMLEFTANIGMFVPLGFFLGVALPRRAWWLGLLLLPGFSGAIEWTQGVALEERVSTLQDVLANSTGGYVGLLVAMILRAMIHARDQKIIARAVWEARARGERSMRASVPPPGGERTAVMPAAWPAPAASREPVPAASREEAPTVPLGW